MTSDKPRGARYWAREWKCHHTTARKLLGHLHRRFGSKAVWRVGPQRALVATRASLQIVQVLRAERNLIVVLGPTAKQSEDPESPVPARRRPEDAFSDDDEYVTQDQFAKALAAVWGALGGRR